MYLDRFIPTYRTYMLASAVSIALSSCYSTMSTGLNSMAGVIYEDMIKPWIRPPVSQVAASRTMKAIVVVAGIICVALVFLVEKLSGLIQVTGSPLLRPPLTLFISPCDSRQAISTIVWSDPTGWQKFVGDNGGTAPRDIHARHVLSDRKLHGNRPDSRASSPRCQREATYFSLPTWTRFLMNP